MLPFGKEAGNLADTDVSCCNSVSRKRISEMGKNAEMEDRVTNFFFFNWQVDKELIMKIRIEKEGDWFLEVP